MCVCVCVCVGLPLLMVKETLRGIHWRTASGWSRGPTQWLGNYIIHVIIEHFWAVIAIVVITATRVSRQFDPNVPSGLVGPHPHSQSGAQTSRETSYAEPRAGCGPWQGPVPCRETSSGGWEESHVEGSTVNIAHNTSWQGGQTNSVFVYFTVLVSLIHWHYRDVSKTNTNLSPNVNKMKWSTLKWGTI